MKNSVIFKIAIITLFMLLLINFNKVVYASNLDKTLETQYDKVETVEGTFYKRKKVDKSKYIFSYPLSSKVEDEEEQKIVIDKTDEYIKKIISKDDFPEEQKIQDNYHIYCIGIYSITDETPYKEGDDIIALVRVDAEPINGDNSYWKNNFSNNELYYNEYDNKYSVTAYLFTRLSMSSETGEYKIAYIGLKPENYDEYISELKSKGIDLENLDVEKIINTKYSDDIEAVASSNTTAISASKADFNSSREEISNIALVIRIICIILAVLIIICIIKKFKKKDKLL